MTPETFCEQFATFAEAPNGVAKLRELILQLAVQGKLGTQDGNDEPASVLAEEIVEYRKQSTGRTATVNLLSADELGFPLPSGWIAARFGDLMVNRDGERVPVSRVIREGRKGPYDYYGASGVIDCIDGFLFDKPLLLIGEDGANLINRSTPIAFIAQGKYWVNNHAHVLDGISLDFLRYIELHINAIDLKPFVTGTAQPKMSQAKMNSIPIALPPLAEQRRIVGKVDQLLGLCDELAARQAARHEARERLVGATLDRLVSCRRDSDTQWEGEAPAKPRSTNDSRSPRTARREPRPPNSAAEFHAHAHRLRDHFDRLFDTPTTLPQLRQAILQLAVQGQLVPQDPNDEPASVSLAKLSEQGGNSKVRRSVPDEVTRPDNLDVDRIPESWAIESTASLLRVGAIIDLKDGNHGANHPKSVEFTETGLPFITAAQVSDEGRIDYDGAYKLSGQPLARLRVGFAKVDDVIYTHKGSVGRVAICKRDCVLSPQTTYYRVNATALDNCYLRIYLMSPAFRSQVDEVKGQTTRDFVSIKTQYNFFVRVPPLSEQKRIVSKVTELLSLCDALEAKLTQAESASTQLLSAAVYHLLNVTSC